jgi:hypothetical protein
MIRYPDIHVTVRSSNPLALVAAVRQALRKAGVESSQIRSFSQQALANEDPQNIRQICRAWVDTAAP